MEVHARELTSSVGRLVTLIEGMTESNVVIVAEQERMVFLKPEEIYLDCVEPSLGGLMIVMLKNGCNLYSDLAGLLGSSLDLLQSKHNCVAATADSRNGVSHNLFDHDDGHR